MKNADNRRQEDLHDISELDLKEFQKGSWFQAELAANNLTFGRAASIILCIISLIGFVGTYAPFSEGAVLSYLNATLVYAIILITNLMFLFFFNREIRVMKREKKTAAEALVNWFTGVNMALSALTLLTTQQGSSLLFEYILMTVVVYLILYLDLRKHIRNMMINILSIILILYLSNVLLAWQDLVDFAALHLICTFINGIRYRNFLRMEENKYLVEKQRSEFYQDSRTDALTGLRNRTSLREDFDTFIGRDICIAMIDLDSFKKFNDNYGHSLGDQVLETTGHFMKETFTRRNDLCYRYGGDEFLIISEEKDSRGFYENLVQLSNKCQNWQDQIRIFLCIGYSFGHPNSQEEIRKLIADADENLYDAKSQGAGKIIGGLPARQGNADRSGDSATDKSILSSLLSMEDASKQFEEQNLCHSEADRSQSGIRTNHDRRGH